MKILVTIPHYCGPPIGATFGASKHPPAQRQEALRTCLRSLYRHFGSSRYALDFMAGGFLLKQPTGNQIDIVICKHAEQHVLEGLDVAVSEIVESHDPLRLGFKCHEVLNTYYGRYDYYCFMEDDIIIHDPRFFEKLEYYNTAFGDKPPTLLQPHRYEASMEPLAKVYIDQKIDSDLIKECQKKAVSAIRGGLALFYKADNPHSGCFFLNANQMKRWRKQKYFLDGDASLLSPLESAATLGIMKTFAVYKPEPWHYLEVEHYGAPYTKENLK
jgi:hypothetical protein